MQLHGPLYTCASATISLHIGELLAHASLPAALAHMSDTLCYLLQLADKGVGNVQPTGFLMSTLHGDPARPPNGKSQLPGPGDHNVNSALQDPNSHTPHPNSHGYSTDCAGTYLLTSTLELCSQPMRLCGCPVQAHLLACARLLQLWQTLAWRWFHRAQAPCSHQLLAGWLPPGWPAVG